MSAHRYYMTFVSANQKTGPIPVTTTDKDSCPSTCPLKDGPCYARFGMLGAHWKRVSEGRLASVLNLDELCGAIKSLRPKQLWRHNQAGDLPRWDWVGMKDCIEPQALVQIVKANKGRRGFTYTHYPWDPEDPDKTEVEQANIRGNLRLIRYANSKDFTINVSCETEAQADRAIELGLPAVLVVPEDAPKSWTTQGGNLVKTCPAVLYDNINCSGCGLCYKRHLIGPNGVARPRHIVAFPSHGPGRKQLMKELRVL